MPTITSANVQQVDGGANFSDMDLQSESDVWGVSLDLEYDFGWATVRSITSYREMEAFTIHDQDGLPITVNSLVNTYDHEQISEELQPIGACVRRPIELAARVLSLRRGRHKPR